MQQAPAAQLTCAQAPAGELLGQADRRAGEEEDDTNEAADRQVQQLWEFDSTETQTCLITYKHTRDGDVKIWKQVANFCTHGHGCGVTAQYWFPANERRASIFHQKLAFRPDWATQGGPTLYYDGGPIKKPIEQYGEFIISADIDMDTLNNSNAVYKLYSSIGGPFGLVCQLEPRQLLCLLLLVIITNVTIGPGTTASCPPTPPPEFAASALAAGHPRRHPPHRRRHLCLHPPSALPPPPYAFATLTSPTVTASTLIPTTTVTVIPVALFKTAHY